MHPTRSPAAPPRLLAYALGCAVTLLMSACGSDAALVGGGGGSGVAEGSWAGDEIAFTYEAGALVSVSLEPGPCSGELGCEATPSATLPGPFSVLNPAVETTIAPAGGGVTLVVSFTGQTQASGTYRVEDEGGCCASVGVWTANWVAPLPGSDAGGGGADGGPLGGGGSLGEVPTGGDDWGGASLGTVHPGPARQAISPARFEGETASQQAASDALEILRAHVGCDPTGHDPAIAKAAQNHADFYVTHAAKYQAAGLSPHSEDASFGEGFTGVSFATRMKNAGFTGPPGAEVMAFSGSPQGAIQGWLETVYHRLPLVDPRTKLMGYGQADNGSARTEVMNTSPRGAKPTDPVVVYPWPGEQGVPRSWSGNEGPQPPPPPTGYPSGPVITARMPTKTTFTSHQLLDADDEPVPHVFLDANNDPNMAAFDANAIAMYAHDPLPAAARFTVVLTFDADGAEQVLRWQFETAP